MVLWLSFLKNCSIKITLIFLSSLYGLKKNLNWSNFCKPFIGFSHLLFTKIIVCFLRIIKSSKFQKQPPEVFYEKGVLKNFVKYTRKHLCLGLFFNKASGLQKKEFLAQAFSCEFYENFKNTFFKNEILAQVLSFAVNFTKLLRTPVLQNTSGQLLKVWHSLLNVYQNFKRIKQESCSENVRKLPRNHLRQGLFLVQSNNFKLILLKNDATMSVLWTFCFFPILMSIFTHFAYSSFAWLTFIIFLF